ncbi:MAG: putative metal-binding motif-containing protein [Myxococcota bacterium]
MWWFLGAGCGLVGEPEVVAVRPTAGGCGAWTVEAEVTGMRGRAVDLTVNGARVHQWHGVWGHRTLVATGRGTPYEPLSFEVQVHDTPARGGAPLELSWATATVGVEPDPSELAEGAAAELGVRIDTTCPLEGVWWRLSVDGWTASGPATDTRVTVPPRGRGVHPVKVELFGPTAVAGRPLAEDVGVLLVGALTDVDRDGDGQVERGDCDDGDPAASSFKDEGATPNGRDDDCDGRVDERTEAFDDDGDGRSERQGDCDDADAGVFPGAAERANCRDDDCDGAVDEGLPFTPLPDDPYEGVDGRHRVLAQVRELRMPLTVVSRDLQDEERIVFDSFDGTFDSWGIDLVASRIPAGAAYGVGIFHADGSRRASGVLRRSGDAVRATGSGWSDDSGEYEVRVTPLALPALGCPVELYLEAR